MQALEQRESALQRANARRRALSELRKALRTGDDTVRDIILRKDPLMASHAILDVIRQSGRKPHSPPSGKLVAMGAAAARNGVNLVVPLGKASDRTIQWVVHYLDEHPNLCANPERRQGKG